jgi:hypothetical protein
MLNAIITATLSFVVFTFGSLLVALQIASGQMTPRIIATILVRDDVVRYTTGLFIFILLFAIRDKQNSRVCFSTCSICSCLSWCNYRKGGAAASLDDVAAKLRRQGPRQ